MRPYAAGGGAIACGNTHHGGLLPAAIRRLWARLCRYRSIRRFGRGYVAIAPYAALGSAIVPLAQYAFAAGYVAIAPYARFFYRASHRHGEGHQIESTQSPDSTLHATVHCV